MADQVKLDMSTAVPIKLDMSTARPIQPVKLDMSTARPINGQAAIPQNGESKLGRLWEALNKPLGHDYAEKVRSDISSFAGRKLPPSIAGPAAYAANVATAIPASAVEFGRRMMTPLSVMTLGAGAGLQALRAIPAVPGVVKTATAGVEVVGGAAFGAQGGIQAITPRQPEETGLQEFERRVGGVGQAILGGLPIAHALAPSVAVVSQEMAGAGRERVAIERMNRESKISQATEKYNEQIAKAQADYKVATGVSETRSSVADVAKQSAYEKKVLEIKESHRQKVQEAETEHTRKVSEIQAKAAADAAQKRAEWVNEMMQVKNLASQRAKVDAQREVSAMAQEQYTKLAMDNAASTEKALRASLSERWNNFRDVVGRETPMDAIKVYDSVVEAKNKFLRGTPASLKQFEDLLTEIGVRRLPEEAGGRKFSELNPNLQDLVRRAYVGLDLETARTHSSAIGEKRFSGDLPGNVYHALGHVQDAIESQIMQAATSKGMGAEYARLKGDWGRYMSDWNDMRSEAVGGSPLARIKRAADAPFVLDQVTGKASDRLIQTYARYRKFGASPELLAKLREAATDAKALPKITVPKMPERPVISPPKLPVMEAVSPPQIPERPGPIPRPIPVHKQVATPRIPPPIDPRAVRERSLLQYAGSPMHLSDVLVVPFINRLMLKSSAFREWVASQPRQELAPIPKPRSTH